MAARRRILVATALTALGCAAQPLPAPQPVSGQPTLAQAVSVRVDVALAQRQLLATAVARRWQVDDVNLLRVKLLQHDGSAYVDTGLAQDLSRKVAPIATGATFQNLAAGKKYRATVEAWGEAGGASAPALLNGQIPAIADFDFTLPEGQALGASRSASVQVQLDDVSFSGTARVGVGGTPGGTQSVEAQLWLQGAQDPVATMALASSIATATFGGLRAGPDYQVKLKAIAAGGAALADAASTAFRFDPDATSLNQELVFNLAFPAASPSPSPSPSPPPSPSPLPSPALSPSPSPSPTQMPTPTPSIPPPSPPPPVPSKKPR